MEVNQALIGQNYWLSVDQVWGQVGDMKPEIIRVGGIAYNETYKGTTWYDNVLNNIETAGASPMVQISEQWTDAQVLELLQHFKNTQRKIDYFSIGNEPDHNNRVSKVIYVNGVAKTVVDVDAIVAYYNRLGPIIRQYYPNSILIGPCWANFYDSFITDYYKPFIDGTKNTKDANGKYLLNVFSFHTYASTYANSGIPLYDLSTFEARMNILLPKIVEVNATRPADEQLSWSVTEFHTTYNNDNINVGGTVYAVPTSHKTYSFYAGQFFAQMYGYAMVHGAFGMMPWSIIEGATNRNFGDLGIFDHDFKPRSTYYHTQMLAANLRSAAVASTSTKTDVEVVAMHDATGTTVMVMNTQKNTYAFTLSLDINSSATNALVVKVDAGSSAQIIDNIGQETTLLFLFDANGNALKKISYSAADADYAVRKDPTVTLFVPVQNYTHTVPGKMEAEEYSNMAGLQTQTTTDSLGGQNLGYTSVGDSAEYAIKAMYNGYYKLDFRVASLAGGAGLSLSIDGVEVIADLAIESTQDWQKWTTLSDTISLASGAHTLKFKVLRAGFNINWINFSLVPVRPQLSFIALTDTLTEGNDLEVHMDASHPAGVEKIDLYLNGVLIRTEMLAPYDWYDAKLKNLAMGEYNLNAIATSTRGETAELTKTITVKSLQDPIVNQQGPVVTPEDPTNVIAKNLGSTRMEQISVLNVQGNIVQRLHRPKMQLDDAKSWIDNNSELPSGLYYLQVRMPDRSIKNVRFKKE